MSSGGLKLELNYILITFKQKWEFSKLRMVNFKDDN